MSNYVTPQQFFDAVLESAKQSGYDTVNPQHPEDIVTNLAPLMEAWAQGWGQGMRAGRAK